MIPRIGRLLSDEEKRQYRRIAERCDYRLIGQCVSCAKLQRVLDAYEILEARQATGLVGGDTSQMRSDL